MHAVHGSDCMRSGRGIYLFGRSSSVLPANAATPNIIFIQPGSDMSARCYSASISMFLLLLPFCYPIYNSNNKHPFSSGALLNAQCSAWWRVHAAMHVLFLFLQSSSVLPANSATPIIIPVQPGTNMSTGSRPPCHASVCFVCFVLKSSKCSALCLSSSRASFRQCLSRVRGLSLN